MSNLYASYASPAVDAAGTEHLVWEDNGRLYHASYDSRAGVWGDKSPVSNARGGEQIRLVAGNIIPVDDSGQIHAPGLIALWINNIGNEREVYAVIGRYNDQGQLEWSDEIQVTVDGAADTALDVAIGQNGLMQLVTTKKVSVDPRKSEYKDNPGQLFQDLRSPERGDSDLYHAPLSIQRDDNTKELSLVLNPKAQMTAIGIKEQGITLNFQAPTSVPVTSGSSVTSQSLLIPNPTQNNGFRSAGLLSLASPNVLAESNGSLTSSSEEQSVFAYQQAFSASASPNFGFDMSIGIGDAFKDGRISLPWIVKKGTETFLGDAFLGLSGSLGASSSGDNYSVSANLVASYGKLASTDTRSELEKAQSTRFLVDPRAGWSFSLGFSGVQINNQDGSLYSIQRNVSLGFDYTRQLKISLIPGIFGPGFLAQGRLTGQIGVDLSLQFLYSDPKEGTKGVFELTPGGVGPSNLGLSDWAPWAALGPAFAGILAVGGAWKIGDTKQSNYFEQVRNDYEGANKSFDRAEKKQFLLAGLGLALETASALPILIAGEPLYSPRPSVPRDDFNQFQVGFGLAVPMQISGQVGFFGNTVGAEVYGNFTPSFSTLFDPARITLEFPWAIGAQVDFGVLNYSWEYGGNPYFVWDWGSEESSTNKAENSLLTSGSTNTGPEEKVQFKLNYSPYQGSTAIYQNERFSPLDDIRSGQTRIGSVSIIDGGSGYLGGETGSFLVLPSIGTAILVAYVEKGVIRQVVVESAGTGYQKDNPPQLDFATYGGGGTGAQGKVQLLDYEVLNLANDSSPFLDSISYRAAGSALTSTALVWIADGADSTKPIAESAGQLTSRVKVATSDGLFWTIAKPIPEAGSQGMNYDPVVGWFINANGRPTLMAVWAHASAEGIGSQSVNDPTNALNSLLATDIYYATLDSFAEEWSTPQKLLSLPGTDTRLDMSRTETGELHLAWVNTEVNASQGDRQIIHSAFFDPLQQSWSTPQTVDSIGSGATNQASIASLRVGTLEGKPALYWSNTAEVSYYQSVLSSAPELYFRLEAASLEQEEQNYASSTAGGYALSFYDGNMSFGQVGALGQDPDPSVKFNGQGALAIGVLDQETVTPADFSVETWVKLTDTAGGKGIITRGQPTDIKATLPSATLTYKVTQKQDKDGKWFYVITPEKIDLGNAGNNIFPGTLKPKNFQVGQEIIVPTLQLEYSDVFKNQNPNKPDRIATYTSGKEVFYQITNQRQLISIGDQTFIDIGGQLGSPSTGRNIYQLTAGQQIKIGNKTYIVPDSGDINVEIKSGDTIEVFDVFDIRKTLSSSLLSILNFAPDSKGQLESIQVNSQQILSLGQGLATQPFRGQAENFTATATVPLEFEQTQDWYLITGEGGKVVFNSGAGEISSSALALNQWHHVVATYNNTTKESILYVDGQEVSRTIGERFVPSDNPILVGYNLKGGLDEVAIYNRVLTTADAVADVITLDEQGKYITGFNPNPAGGEITSHFQAKDVDPNSAEEATYYSVWDGKKWQQPEQFTAEPKLTPTRASLSRSPAVDIVSDKGLQPDGLPDQHLQIALAFPNKFIFGQSLTEIEITSSNGDRWNIGQATQSDQGANLIGVMLGGQKLNDLQTGKIQHTVMGPNEVLDLYFDDPLSKSNITYDLTLKFSNDNIVELNNLAPTPNQMGQSKQSGIVKAEILENEVTQLSEVDSGIVIDIDTAGAGQSLTAGARLRNGQPGFAIGHPYQLDADNSTKGLVWVLPAGSNKKLNDLTGIPLKNDQVPEGGSLILGKPGDKIGYAMAVGDIDGDGIDDLILGAPDAENGRGVVYVISGKYLGSGQTIDLTTLPANAVVTIKGTASSRAGFSVAAGDVNANGFDDIVIGAPNGRDDNGNRAGAVHVISGGINFFNGNPTINLGVDNRLFLGSNGTVKGEFSLFPETSRQWHSQVGYSVAVVRPGTTGNAKANTFNADLMADILIGAPGYHQTVSFNIDGDPRGFSASLLEQYRSIINHVPNSGNGSVPPQKDINTGRAYLIFGGQNLMSQGTLNDTNLKGKGVIFDGTPLEDTAMRLGQSVASAGDMNGDGYIDIALAAPEAGGKSGFVFIFAGRGGSDSIRLKDQHHAITESEVMIVGGDVFNYAGQSLAGVGDVNNDKIDDLLIGVPQGARGQGQSFVIFGVEGFKLSQGKFPTVISLKQGIPDNSFVFNGGIAQGLAGTAIAKGFDLNGDSIGDMLLSAPLASQVYVGFGKPWLKKEGSIRLDNLANDNGIIISRYEGSEPKYLFDGSVVTNLGDINGDGYDDVAVGGNGESLVIQFGGSTWNLIDSGPGVGQLSVFLKKDLITDINFESVEAIGDINNDNFDDFIIYNSRSKIKAVHDFIVVYGGEYLNSLGSATIDVNVTPGEEVRQRKPSYQAGFALGKPKVPEAYRQSLGLGESIYSPVHNFYFSFVNQQARLTLEENGILNYYDYEGKIQWSSGKADIGIVKMELGQTTDQKTRLLFKDKDDNIVFYSEQYLDHGQGKNDYVPYLRVGKDFVTLDHRTPDHGRESKSLYDDSSSFSYNFSTVWGNSLISIIGEEAFTSTDGKRSLLLMNPGGRWRDGIVSDKGTGYELVLVEKEEKDGQIATKDIWSPHSSSSWTSPLAGSEYEDISLRMLDDGNLILKETERFLLGSDEVRTLWETKTSNNNFEYPLFLHLNPLLTGFNLVENVSDSGGNSGILQAKTIYGTPVTSPEFNSAGDLNGDGFSDIVYFDTNKISVYFGSNSDPDSTTANFNNLSKFEYESPGFGLTGGVGDINGDGKDVLFTLSREGTFISYGFETSSPVINKTVNIPGFSTNVNYFDNQPSIWGVGDVNGDGIGDFAIRDTYIKNNQNQQALRLVYGNTTGDNFQSTQIQIPLSLYSGLLTFSGIGDINADGFDDVIFADPGHNNNEGKIYILLGGLHLNPNYQNFKAVFSPEEVEKLSDSFGFTVAGLPNSRAGASVSGGGDINGDGFKDFIIGAPGIDGTVGLTYGLFGGDFTKSVHQAGTSANDILKGTGTGDVIMGLVGNDTLMGNGGRDVLYGGAGDDTIIIADAYFQRIDGDSGFNTLKLEGYRGQDWDLTNLSPGLRLQNISAIDMTNYGSNTLTLNKTTVMKMTGTQNNLVILGDANDEIILDAEFQKVDSFNLFGTLFDRYQAGTANVLVSPNIKTQVRFTADPINRPTGLPVPSPSSSSNLLLSSANPNNFTSIPGTSNGQPTQFFVVANPTREDAGVFTFTVNRSGDLSKSVTALYQTVNDTAIAGRDYTATLGTLVFAPGEISKVIEVPLLDNDVYGGNNRSFGLAIQPVDDIIGLEFGSHYINLQTESDSQLRNLDKGTLSLATAIQLNSALPLGAMDFKVTAPGGKTIITQPFKGVTDINSYFRFNIGNGQYEEFLYDGETGVEFIDSSNDGQIDTMRVHLVDGGRGDNDGLVNGVITGSDAPAQVTPGPIQTRPGLFYIPTAADGQIQFHYLKGKAGSELGLIPVDDVTGRIGSLLPNNPGYAEAALSRKIAIFQNSIGSNLNAMTPAIAKNSFLSPELLVQTEFQSNGSFQQMALNGNQHYAFYLSEAGQTSLSFNNPSFALEHEGRGFFDVDWDGLTMEMGTPLMITPGTVNQQVEVTFDLARGGAFNNTIALFKVDTLTGQLDLNGDGTMDLAPGDKNYVIEALNRSQDALTGFVVPRVDSIFTATTKTTTLFGGQTYGMVLVTNGTIDDFLQNNPTNSPDGSIHAFLSFEQANADGISHVRRLGDNLWGFEDLLGGGDRDYNDMVLQVTFANT